MGLTDTTESKKQNKNSVEICFMEILLNMLKCTLCCSVFFTFVVEIPLPQSVTLQLQPPPPQTNVKNTKYNVETSLTKILQMYILLLCVFHICC